MRDPHLRAIEYKIARIRTMRRVGKMLLVTAVIVAGIITLSHLDATWPNKKSCPIVSEKDNQWLPSRNGSKYIYGTELAPQELDLVCRVVSAEARGESLDGQMAVAQVIRDRANSWDMTVTEVVTAPSQFAKPYQGEISDETYLVASVFNGMSVLQEPVTHFYSGEREPYWTSDKVNRGSIGRHSFWY